MTKTLKGMAVLLSLFIIVVFGVFLFNQTAQIVQSARTVNARFGDGVMWGLVFLYSALLLAPIVLWFKVPKRKSPPARSEGPEYEQFMADFRKRLSRNARLRGVSLTNPEEVDAAICLLDKHSDDLVVSTASAVFLSTAVLQSGRLDVLVVLVAQTRMIWRMAHVYYQRPSLRDLVHLYANVASTAFIAAGIEDLDVDVLVSTIFGSTVAAIPGMHILAEAVLSGSANAFLTLRVGMIAKEYCRCTTRVEKSGLRRVATLQAAKLLGSIVKDGTSRLSKAAMAGTKSRFANAWNRMRGSRGIPEPGQVG
jgi:hypothetical protein